MSEVRVCFLGTPEFALPSLKLLFEDPHYKVVGVVTQPDRPRGRNQQVQPSPVKTMAIKFGLPVLSPASVNDPEVLLQIQAWKAEVAVVVAFGQILRQQFLESFRFGVVNVHGSLLPRWRGAAPIQRALEAGDRVSGVCLQKVVAALDAGDVLGERLVNIEGDLSATELMQQLAVLGADLLHIELMDFIRGNLAPKPQDPSGVTYAKKILKEEAILDWNLPAEVIHNKVRGFSMGPGTWTLFQGKKLKIVRTGLVSAIDEGKSDLKHEPGKLIISDQRLFVETGSGLLELLEVQPESRQKVLASEFVRGLRVDEKRLVLGE